jgi:hypothetical protein
MATRRAPVLMALCMFAGALVGSLGWLLQGVGGFALWVLLGAAAGLAAAGLGLIYARSFSVTEMTLHVPPVTQVTMAVNQDARDTAWEIFVELATRVSTQPVPNGDGSVREALSSLHALFVRIRELLATARPNVKRGRSVQHLGLTLLNGHLRPFLTKWHPRLAAFEMTAQPEAAWADNEACRAELDQLRLALIDFAISFARVADVDDPRSLIE